jgi:hypothetical protein
MTSTDRNHPYYRNRAVGLAKIVARLGERCINPIGRISVRPRSRGGVKVPTGGNGERSPEPASARRAIGGVSRFGVIPKPTVTVRMEENGKIWRTHCCVVL